MKWTVHKFGGTSLASAERYRRVGDILAARDEPRQAVVVSAMGGITDALLDCVRRAASGDDYREGLAEIRDRQSRALSELTGETDDPAMADAISDIEQVLHVARLTGRADQPILDLVSGFGELWSARLLARHLAAGSERRVRWLDARLALVVEHGEMGPDVDWDASTQALRRFTDEHSPDLLVVTGYVASDAHGRPTTLGRNGSDFSATIFARLLDAESVHIWTDVDGVMSADPRLVPDARVIDELSFNEALELAYFGARVLHPQTLSPAIDGGIPVHIRNTFNPTGPSTRIGPDGSGRFAIKGISAIHDLALVNLEGAGMIGVPGTARRVFGALKRAGISVIMISQGSSEHSICFVVRSEDARAAKAGVEEEFEDELRQGYVQSVTIQDDVSILAVVGDAMAGQPGVASRFFSALAAAGINVRAIAQGSSERNISAVIDSAAAARAVRAVHGAFYLSPQTLSIGVIGTGHVGGELLSQMAGQLERLETEAGVDLRIRAVADSKRMVLAERAIDPSRWRERLDADGEPVDLDALVRHVHADHLPHAAIVDCTASGQVAARHRRWLADGIHVVTPNKKANAADLSQYGALRDAMRQGPGRYFYETTVGAGLPIIHTLRDLRQTGDHIHAIEGIFSGTLAYLFNRYDGSTPFSALVREAWESGYTEPDPRDDLSGMDVARKLVILARELEMELEVGDLELETLVPDALADVTVEAFVDGLSTIDDAMQERLHQARSRGNVLRYVAKLDDGGNTEVGLAELPGDHPFAHANLTDNVVRFVTDRYRDNPLTVQGPGAGPAVTAAGVFADLLRLCTSLGARI